MNRLIVSLVAAVSLARAFAGVDFAGVEALARRVDEALASKVSFTELTGVDGEQAKIVPPVAEGAPFTIQATSPRMASFALGHYIREIAGGHISWCGTELPSTWNLPTSEVVVKPVHPYAIAYNYCTLSYTMAFWGESAWQIEIDRLALQGYNVALVTAGLQKVWQLTLRDMGYSEDQIHNFIADDAVSAWWHMGNLQAKGNFNKAGIAYPVTDAQIDLDGQFAQQLVEKMRVVGIEPIIQSFIGLIPSTTTSAQLEALEGVGAGNARIFRNGNYVDNQKNPDLLDPTSPAFAVFSAAWNKNLKTVYGFTEANPPKFLGGDLFHESAPPSSMSYNEGRACAVNIQSYQKAAFGDDVIWVLQSWQGSPAQVIRDGLDPHNTLIQYLDQGMESTGTINFTCQNRHTGAYLPWVWCEVMNFGGNTGMYGAFRRFKTIGNLSSDPNFMGYGLLSEGLETNPSSYEMYASTFDQPNAAAQNITDEAAWLKDYRVRRYGLKEMTLDEEQDDIEALKKAHEICARTVWDCKARQQGALESVFCGLPGWNFGPVSSWGPGGPTPYNREELVQAARYFLSAAEDYPELLEKETFRYDFVEIFQQILADKAREILPNCQTDRILRDRLREMIDLLDQILACSTDWRLDAKEARLTKVAAGTDARAAYRRMITTWVPGSWGVNTSLGEYAHRSYAGLIKHYYGARWLKFLDVADGKMTTAEYNAYINNLAVNFPTMDLTTTANQTPTNGDPLTIAQAILDVVSPKVLTWTGAANDNRWDGKNWNNNVSEDVSAWENGADAVVSNIRATLTTPTAVQVGDFDLFGFYADTSKSYAGNPIQGATGYGLDLGWANVTLDALLASEFSGVFGGEWIAGNPTGYGYQVTQTSDQTLTVQVQTVDGGFVKVVALQLTVADNTVYAKHLWAGYTNDLSKLGTDLSTATLTEKWTSYNGRYVICGLNCFEASRLTLASEAPAQFKGVTTLYRGNELAVPNGTTFAKLKVAGDAAVLNLGSDCKVTIQALELSADGKLILKGTAGLLWDAAEDTQGAVFKTAEGEVYKPRTGSLVYVCTTVGDPNYNQEQLLTVDSETGAAVRVIPPQAMEESVWIPKTAIKTGWKNLTLEDLARMEFTAKMAGKFVNPYNASQSAWPARGYVVTNTGDAVGVQMQIVDDGYLKSVNLELTLDTEDEVCVKALRICNRQNGSLGTDTTHLANSTNWGNPDVVTDVESNGYGVFGLIAQPAIARVAATGSNYTDFTAACNDAKNQSNKNLSLIADATLSASRSIKDGVCLTIEPGVTLTSGVTDLPDYAGTSTLVVKGTLDLAQTRWTISNNVVLNLTAGARILGAGDSLGGLEIHGMPHTVRVAAAEGEAVAEIRAPIRTSQDVTFDVADGVTLTVGRFVPGNSNNHVIRKTGLGTLVLTDAIHGGVTVATGDEASGVLQRTLTTDETFSVTQGAGEVTFDITVNDPDYKVISSTFGNTVTFTAEPCLWVANVTENNPEARAEDPGTKFEAIEDAMAYYLAKRPIDPTVKLWLLGTLKDAQATFEGWETIPGPAGCEILPLSDTPNPPLRPLTGSACWYEWLFDTPVAADFSTTVGRNAVLASTGRVQGQYSQLGPDTIAADAYVATAKGRALKISAGALQDHLNYFESLEAPNWSASFFACMPSNAGGTLISFGSSASTTPGQGCLALVRGLSENQVVLVYLPPKVNGVEQDFVVLADMKVPHAETDYHLYSFVVYGDDPEEDADDPRIEIFLDQALWTTVKGAFNVASGIQMGALYYWRWGGARVETPRTHEGYVNGGQLQLQAAQDAEGDTTPAAVDMLRIYDSPLTLADVERLSAEYEYISPYGTFERTVAGGTVNWMEPGAWAEISGATTTTVDHPVDGEVLLTATADTTLRVNLPDATEAVQEVELEGLTFLSDEGATITLSDATLQQQHITVTGNTMVETDVIVDLNAVTLEGPVDVAEGKTLTLVLSADLLTKWGADYATLGHNIQQNLTGYCAGTGSIEIAVADGWSRMDVAGVITFTKDEYLVIVQKDALANCWRATFGREAWAVTIDGAGVAHWTSGGQSYTSPAPHIFLDGGIIEITAQGDGELLLNGATPSMIVKGTGTVTLRVPTADATNPTLTIRNLIVEETANLVLTDAMTVARPTVASTATLTLGDGTSPAPAILPLVNYPVAGTLAWNYTGTTTLTTAMNAALTIVVKNGTLRIEDPSEDIQVLAEEESVEVQAGATLELANGRTYAHIGGAGKTVVPVGATYLLGHGAAQGDIQTQLEVAGILLLRAWSASGITFSPTTLTVTGEILMDPKARGLAKATLLTAALVGSGTIANNIALTEGATIEVGETPLTVDGTVSATGTLHVRLPAAPTQGTPQLLATAGASTLTNLVPDISVDDQPVKGWTVKNATDGLYLRRKGFMLMVK